MKQFLLNRYHKWSVALRLAVYRHCNRLRSRPRILLYTDSRGINIPGQFNYVHYSMRLAKHYSVDAYLCPQKWTTTLDFLTLIRTINLRDYAAIVLHTGVVEFSPRHREVLRNTIYPEKKSQFDDIFGEGVIGAHLTGKLPEDYEGDHTLNMYSLEMASQYILPRLLAIPTLVWISGNPIVPGWQGNYWKPRPVNLSIVEAYDQLFLSALPHTIDLTKWSQDEVKEYTFDGIHVNSNGSDLIWQQLHHKLTRILTANE